MAIPIALAVAGETLKFGAKQYLAPALAKLGTSALKNIGVSNIMGLFGDKSSSSAKAAAEQYQYNLALQQQAQQWNEYMYRNRYQMQVEDLEKAGINKLYGLGNAPSVTSGTNSIGMPDYVGEKNAKRQAIMQGIALMQEWSAKKAEIENKKQQTVNLATENLIQQEDLYRKRIENKYIDKKEKAWLEQEIKKIELMKQIIQITGGTIPVAKLQGMQAEELINTLKDEIPKEKSYRNLFKLWGISGKDIINTGIDLAKKFL